MTQLAAEGVIEGYGDGTFLGNRNITRYEMAQMVAKALARNPQGADRAALDRLAAEFADELNNLGVRVSELEKYADRVKINGKIEYTYHSYRPEQAPGGKKNRKRINDDTFVFRIRVGKPDLYTNEDGLLWDSDYSGADIRFGNRLQTTIYAGRFQADTTGGGTRGYYLYRRRQGARGRGKHLVGERGLLVRA